MSGKQEQIPSSNQKIFHVPTLEIVCLRVDSLWIGCEPVEMSFADG